MDTNTKKLRIELLVAGPPTKKCKLLIQMMTSFLEQYPDSLHLDIYYAGEAMTIVPTDGYQRDPADKNRRVPSAYINGKKIASREVPDKNDVEKILLEEMSKSKDVWQ